MPMSASGSMADPNMYSKIGILHLVVYIIWISGWFCITMFRVRSWKDSTIYLDVFMTYVYVGIQRPRPLEILKSTLYTMGFSSFLTNMRFILSSTDDHLYSGRLRPLLIPSRTTHRRLFPKEHSFSYSYFLVGIPVGWQGYCGSLLSADLKTGQVRSWYHVDAANHLLRDETSIAEDPVHLRIDAAVNQRPLWRRLYYWIAGINQVKPKPIRKDLKTKLSEYLRSQNVEDNEWKQAYLVTAPSFLGYNFNPVSFWYIYSQDDQLSMMILEVNNTFDERRIYFQKVVISEGDTKESTESTASFTHSWEKDFHVSPFNSRKGSYSLRAKDPFAATEDPKIDQKITLESSKSHGKLVATVFSTSSSIDPSRTNFYEALIIVLRHSWIGFLTFPRIIYEAAKLYFGRKLHVWYRPEVTPSSIGRQPTPTERDLEPFFAAFLDGLVRRSETPLIVTYHAACNRASSLAFVSEAKGKEFLRLQIRVLSPAFYSRLAHYTRFSEALDRECLFTDPKNCTLSISDPQLLVHLKPAQELAHVVPRTWNPLSSFGWFLLRILRCPPAAPAYPDPVTPKDPAYETQDIRPSRLSDLDIFVRSTCVQNMVYWRAVMKMNIVQRFCGGVEQVLFLVDWPLRFGLMYLGVRMFKVWDGQGGFVGFMEATIVAWGIHLWAKLLGRGW